MDPTIMPEDPICYIMAAFQGPPSPGYIPCRGAASRHPHWDTLICSWSNLRKEPEADDEDPRRIQLITLLLGMMMMMRRDVDECGGRLSNPELLAVSVPPVKPSPPASLLPASPPLQLLSFDHRTDRPEITLPPQKRLGIDLGHRYKIGESSVAVATRPVGGRRTDYGFVGTMDTEIRRQRAEEVGYGIRDVWVDPREAVEEVAPMTLERVNAREALVSREAWGRSIEVSYMTRSKILALRSVVLGQQAVISQLQAVDRKSQVVTSKMLQANHQRQVQLAEALKLLKGLQTQMV
ncbi:hypothetical protein Tco_0683907 [Tanacetum coccineum]